MSKHVSFILPFLTCLTFACDAGQATTGGGSSDGDDHVFVDDTDDADFGLVCSGELSLSGTFTPDPNAPATDGCQPFGTWTVNADVSDLGSCDSMDDAVGEYIYTISLDADTGEKNITYQGDDPSNPANLKQSIAGSTCRGQFAHSIGGVELNIQPFVNGTEITGKADYERYSE